MARSASTLATLLLAPLLTRALGPEAFGVLVTVTATAALATMADLGIANAIITRLSGVEWASETTRDLVSAAGALLVVAAAVTTLFSGVAAVVLPLPRLLNAPMIADSVLRWSAFFALLGVSLGIATSLGQKLDLIRQRGHVVAAWTALATVLGQGAAAWAAIAGCGLATVVACAALLPPFAFLCQSIVSLRSLPAQLRPRPSAVDWRLAARLVRTGSVYFGLSVVGLVSFNIDTLIVSSALGAASAAQFDIVVRIGAVVSGTFVAALAQLWSAFAQAMADGHADWARSTLIRSTWAGIALGAAATAGMVAVGAPVIGWWFGQQYRPSALLLLSAGIWTTYAMAVHPLAMFLNGSNLHRQQLAVAAPMAVANVGLSVWLAHVVGSSGPLIGSLVSNLLLVALPLGLLARRRLALAGAPSDSPPGVPPGPGQGESTVRRS